MKHWIDFGQLKEQLNLGRQARLEAPGEEISGWGWVALLGLVVLMLSMFLK